MLEAISLEHLSADYLLPWAVNIGIALLIFVIGRLVANLIVGVIKRLMGRAKADPMLVDFVSSIANAGLMLFVIIATLDKLGVDTTSLIAIFGAAGLAIGLALQGALQNFAAGVMLILFRPFHTGDYVEAGGTSGTVELITLFTTTMKTPDNKEVIVPNGKIYSGIITNFSARPTRRVDMVFSISYEDSMKRAKEIIESVLAADERILKDPAWTVAVSELGDSSVNLVARPWVRNADYWAVKFAITEKVKEAFDANNITIPFPQMDLHLDKQGA